MTRATAARSWLRLRLRLPEAAAEAVGVACIDLGAPGVVTAERDLRRAPASGDRDRSTRLEAHFPRARDRAKIERELRAVVESLRPTFASLDPDAVVLEHVTVPDYAPLVRSHFPPLAIGRRLFVVPPWTPARERARAAAAGKLTLVVEPAQAFGTGHHATTRGCLVAIERASASQPPRRALDVGSGSGILSVALRQLGADAVVAIDVDPVARAATAETARANRATGIRVVSALSAARGRFDLIVANLFADLLIDMAGALAERLHRDGLLIVAGLLARQEASVRDAFAVAGLEVARRQARSTWVVLELRRRADVRTPESAPRSEPRRAQRRPAPARRRATRGRSRP